MPVKWDPIMEQRLLLAALERKEVDDKKVAKMWEGTFGESFDQ